MGAWGTGVFDSEAALGWFGDLRMSAYPLFAIRLLLDKFAGEGSAGDELLLAATVMAAVAGEVHPKLETDSEYSAWLTEAPFDFDAQLAREMRADLELLVDPNRSRAAEQRLEGEFPAPAWFHEVERVGASLDRVLGRPIGALPRVAVRRHFGTLDSG
ncbi:MAG: DUF4259 domain-containing protein [Polyangiaceae bacterium]